ncbi:MAG: hypothetical protein IJ087_16090, partial [Eggerthellaceae bacterium]|nr:hypothetical protein [Eggerthellaceae bacterium]
MAKGAKIPDAGIRVTPTGAVRTATWKIVPSADTIVKGSTQELLLDASALDRYEEFTNEMHAILQKYEAAMRQMVVRFEILD